MGCSLSFVFLKRFIIFFEKIGYGNVSIEICDVVIFYYCCKGLNKVYIEYWLYVCVMISYFWEYKYYKNI